MYFIIQHYYNSLGFLECFVDIPLKNDLDSLHINLINLCSDGMICDDNYNYIDVIKLTIYLINSFKAYFDIYIF